MTATRRLLGLATLALGAWLGVQWLAHRTADGVAVDVRPGDVQMIASVDCRFCAEARAWFRAHGVPFGECVIEHDAACADAYRALQAPGTPVLLVRGRRLVGFEPRAIADALR